MTAKGMPLRVLGSLKERVKATQLPPVLPAEVRPTAQAGLGLFASMAVPRGTVVAVFKGPVVEYASLPAQEAAHAFMLDNDTTCMVIETVARFANHACAPNCAVLSVDTGVNGPVMNALVTRRAMDADEEYTFHYNLADPTDPPDVQAAYFWDERWTFECRCGSPHCQGLLDGYVTVPDSERPTTWL